MNTVTILSAACLAFGAIFLILAVALLGAPLTDVGMLSTAAVFILFGVVGLALGRAQDEAAPGHLSK